MIGAFNAGIAEHDGEVLMLLRVAERPVAADPDEVAVPVYDPALRDLVVHTLRRSDARYDFSDPRAVAWAGSHKFAYLTSISYLRLARSRDGVHFTVDETPFLYPETALETYGVEDPRITKMEDTYYITYTAVSPAGVGVGLASTRDFRTVRRHGVILPPENKDVVLFPERIGGKYYMLHRPVPTSNGAPEVWLAESPDLVHWGNHRHLLGLRPGRWDSARIGAGAVPIRTPHGWLELYHGADSKHRYCMGAALLALDDPSRVIARSAQPILEPEADYEIHGFFGNVVFSCGALLQGDVVRMYYGVSDTSMACADIPLADILNTLEPV